MGRADDLRLRADPLEDVRPFFETQLRRIGLSETQIDKQDTASLEDSLIRVDDALRNAESFGVLRLGLSGAAGGGFLVMTRSEDARLEIGIVPILLERKKLITERIRKLRAQRPIETLAELIESVSEPGLKEKLRTELNASKQVAQSGDAKRNVNVGSAFIAMAMDPNDPSLEDVLDAIKDGATKCGVEAQRIDEDVSNEPITRRMLAAIEEAEFVVVDITHARPNVFYEAGYAHGLGKTPIYISKKGTEIPFDVKTTLSFSIRICGN